MSHSFCTFELAGELFCVPVEAVQEVIRHHAATPVPLSPPAVRGLINLRGQIVVVVDLARLLGIDTKRSDAQPPNIVVHTSDGPLSLEVDDIGDVLDVDPEAIEAPPPTMPSALRRLTRGVCKLEGRLMVLLDVDRTLERVGSDRPPPADPLRPAPAAA